MHTKFQIHTIAQPLIFFFLSGFQIHQSQVWRKGLRPNLLFVGGWPTIKTFQKFEEEASSSG